MIPHNNTAPSIDDSYWEAANFCFGVYVFFVGILLNIWHLIVLRQKKLRENPIFFVFLLICVFNTVYIVFNVREVLVEPWISIFRRNNFANRSDAIVISIYRNFRNLASSMTYALIILLAIVTSIRVSGGKHVQYTIAPNKILLYLIGITVVCMNIHSAKFFCFTRFHEYPNHVEVDIDYEIYEISQFCATWKFMGNKGLFQVGNLIMTWVLWEHRKSSTRVYLVILLQLVYLSVDFPTEILNLVLPYMHWVSEEWKIFLTILTFEITETVKLLRAGIFHILLFWFSKQYVYHAQHLLRSTLCAATRRNHHRMMIRVRGGPPEEMSSEVATVMEGYELPLQN